MTITIAPAELRRLRALARRLSRDASAAEDLLQDALIVAIRTGRLGEAGASNWMAGVMRNLALTTARAEARRRRREAIFVETCADGGAAESPPVPPQFIDSLPPSLRSVALLAAAGATRAEIGHLLGLADTALRQRLAALRKRWRAQGEQDFAAAPDLAGRLALGSIRRALLPLARRTRFLLASHDPDGHLFAFGKFQAGPHIPAPGGN